MGEFEVSGQLHASAALPPGKEPVWRMWRRENPSPYRDKPLLILTIFDSEFNLL
jgi:hypothetical protein